MSSLATRRPAKEERGFKRSEPIRPDLSAPRGTVASVVKESVRETLESTIPRSLREEWLKLITAAVRQNMEPYRRASRLLYESYSDVALLVMRDVLSELQRLELGRFLSWSPDPFATMLGKGGHDGSERCASRLLHLLRLPDDWHDNDSSSPTATAMSSATVLLRLVPNLMPVVSIFPTYSGGVMLEYEHDGWDWSAEIQPAGEVEIHGVELQGEEEFLKQVSGVGDALEIVRQHAP